jgi:hypothetical protein
MNVEKPSRPNSTKVNLWYDLALFGAIMLALSPVLTGTAPHEWLGIALGVAIIIHLLLHWAWIVATFTRFFQQMSTKTRLNLLLNLALFIDLTLVIFTGLLISRVALPFFGLVVQSNFVWRGVHSAAANLLLLIFGLHLAIHWKWIANAGKRYLVNPIWEMGPKAQPQSSMLITVPVESEVKQ